MGKAWCASWLKARQRNPDTIFPKRKALNPIFTLQHIPLVQTSEKRGLKILGRFLPKKKKKLFWGLVLTPCPSSPDLWQCEVPGCSSRNATAASPSRFHSSFPPFTCGIINGDKPTVPLTDSYYSSLHPLFPPWLSMCQEMPSPPPELSFGCLCRDSPSWAIN